MIHHCRKLISRHGLSCAQMPTIESESHQTPYAVPFVYRFIVMVSGTFAQCQQTLAHLETIRLRGAVTLGRTHPDPEGFTIHNEGFSVVHVLLAGLADVHVVFPPLIRPVLPPFHVPVMRIVLLEPDERGAKLFDIDSERCFHARPTAKTARTHLHIRHAAGKRRELLQELGHLLAEIAHMSDISQLPRPRDGVHLTQRMHQCQHHLLAVG